MCVCAPPCLIYKPTSLSCVMLLSTFCTPPTHTHTHLDVGGNACLVIVLRQNEQIFILHKSVLIVSAPELDHDYTEPPPTPQHTNPQRESSITAMHNEEHTNQLPHINVSVFVENERQLPASMMLCVCVSTYFSSCTATPFHQYSP